jgi:HSP20 family protein
MAIRDLVPWNRGRDVAVRREDDHSPFLALHREMNRLFDDVFRSFDVMSPGERLGDRTMGWPNIEVSEAAGEITVTAELPGMGEKDVDVQLVGGTLIIAGEKKAEAEDKDRLFTERYYGRFERRIPLEGIDESKVSASFKNGLLMVKLPQTEAAMTNVKRIAINGK